MVNDCVFWWGDPWVVRMVIWRSFFLRCRIPCVGYGMEYTFEVLCIEWIGWKCIALRIGVWSRIQRRNWNTKTNRENCCFHTKCQSNADDGRVWETVHFPLHHRHWSEKSHKRSHSVMTIDTTTAVRTEFAKSIARTVLLFAGTILAGTTRRRYNTMHLPLTLHTKA